MSDTTRATEAQDEPDLLRDQFRQLIRYRALIVAGLLVGLFGGAWLAVTGSDSYTATSEVMVQAATADPFAAGISADKSINIGSERQTATSSSIADDAAAIAKVPADTMSHCLQVTNPPNSLVLRFTCTTGTAADAAGWVNAFTKAYLDNRESHTKRTVDSMVKNYRAQLDPVTKQRDALLKQIDSSNDAQVTSALTTQQTNLLSRILELQNSISGLKAMDTTPGQIIKPGKVPGAPSGPGLPMMLGLGGGVGIALGLLGAWVRLVFDPAVRSEGEVARTLGAPVLGTLPRSRRGRGSGPAPLLAEGQNGGRLAEEYRAVGFRLAHDKRFADRRRLLVVAPRGSSETSAGVAVNLSASFAEMGMEVLLVEADLRTPSLSARLRTADGGARPGWARSPGLGEGGWPAGLQVSIDAGESGSFDLVPGRRVRNVARALTSAPATRLFAEADTPGAAVVVLAPAVLAYADALALADRVDGVVVVCDPRQVHRDDLVRVRELISAAGGAVLGVVLHSVAETGPKRRLAFGRRRRASSGRRADAGSGGTGTVPAAPRHDDGELSRESSSPSAPERHPVP